MHALKEAVLVRRPQAIYLRGRKEECRSQASPCGCHLGGCVEYCQIDRLWPQAQLVPQPPCRKLVHALVISGTEEFSPFLLGRTQNNTIDHVLAGYTCCLTIKSLSSFSPLSTLSYRLNQQASQPTHELQRK